MTKPTEIPVHPGDTGGAFTLLLGVFALLTTFAGVNGCF